MQVVFQNQTRGSQKSLPYNSTAQNWVAFQYLSPFHHYRSVLCVLKHTLARARARATAHSGWTQKHLWKKRAENCSAAREERPRPGRQLGFSRTETRGGLSPRYILGWGSSHHGCFGAAPTWRAAPRWCRGCAAPSAAGAGGVGRRRRRAPAQLRPLGGFPRPPRPPHLAPQAETWVTSGQRWDPALLPGAALGSAAGSRRADRPRAAVPSAGSPSGHRRAARPQLALPRRGRCPLPLLPPARSGGGCRCGGGGTRRRRAVALTVWARGGGGGASSGRSAGAALRRQCGRGGGNPGSPRSAARRGGPRAGEGRLCAPLLLAPGRAEEGASSRPPGVSPRKRPPPPRLI